MQAGEGVPDGQNSWHRAPGCGAGSLQGTPAAFGATIPSPRCCLPWPSPQPRAIPAAWGLQSSREKLLPGWWLKEPLSWALQGTPGCSGSWAGGTSVPCARTAGVVGPSTTSDSNTTGCRVAWWVSPLPSPCPRGGHGTQWAAPLHHGW